MSKNWIVWFSIACVGAVVAVLLIFWATVGFGGMGLSGNGVAAIILGITFSTAIAVALMALIFYSNRTQQDEAVHNAGVDHKP